MHTLLPLDFMQMGFFLYSRSLPQYENIIVEQRQTIWMLGSCLIILLIVFLVMVVVIGIFICRFRNRKSTNNPPLLSVSAEKREHLDSIYTLIYQYVVTEKHYLDKDIDISEVARHCNIGKDLVNKALVSKKNMTLLDFVNSYRIEYAGSLLLDPANKTVEVVAGEAGFNTTRTFLRQFKSKYNISTSEYRKLNWNK